MKVYIIVLAIASSSVMIASAQDAPVSAGGDISGVGGFLSFSVGLTLFSTDESNTHEVAKGVQHAFEIFDLATSVESSNALLLSIFPNPTSDALHIAFANNWDNYRIEIYDVAGSRVMYRDNVYGDSTVDISSLPASVYLVKISDQLGKSSVTKLFKK